MSKTDNLSHIGFPRTVIDVAVDGGARKVSRKCTWTKSEDVADNIKVAIAPDCAVV